MKDLEPDKRREVGAIVNSTKTVIESEIERRYDEIQRLQVESELNQSSSIDLTLPGFAISQLGSLHPVTHVAEQMISALKQVGFSLAFGPEV